MAQDVVIIGAGKRSVNRHAAKMRLRNTENLRVTLFRKLLKDYEAGRLTEREYRDLRAAFWDDRRLDLHLIRGGVDKPMHKPVASAEYC
jgi:hypothetical protein